MGHLVGFVRRHALAVAFAMTLVVALVVGAVALSGRGDSSGRDGRIAPGAEAPEGPPRRSTAAEVPLREGQCGEVNGLLVAEVLDPARIRTLPCTEPHDVEVGAVFDYPAGAAVEFPGEAAVDDYAASECQERFEAYVGTPYAESSLDYVVVAPGAEGWAEGDRRIACILFHADFARLTAPVAGSGS